MLRRLRRVPVGARVLAALGAGVLTATVLQVTGAAAAATRYEAETATLSQSAVASNHTGFSGTGFVDYTNVTGGFVEFTVNAPAAGNYGLTFRYANGTAVNRPMDISVGGTVVAPNLAFNQTTNWDTWADQSATVTLAAGTNKVRATATSANGGPTLARLRVSNPTDTEAPTPPGNFHPVADPTPFAVDVTWSPSTDNVGVVLYRVYNGGNVMAEVGGNVTTAHITLKPNNDYLLSAAAFDAAGHASHASNSYSVPSPPRNDTTPPSVPGNLHTTNLASSSISLAPNASTDDTGVAGYNVYRDGVKFATVPDLTATADSLQPDTQYSFTVEAFDDNGNTSAKAPAITAKTLPADNGGSGGDPSLDRDISTNVDPGWAVAFLPDKTALATERDRFEILRFTLSGQKTVLGKITEARTTGGGGGPPGIAPSPALTPEHFVCIYFPPGNRNPG